MDEVIDDMVYLLLIQRVLKAGHASARNPLIDNVPDSAARAAM